MPQQGPPWCKAIVDLALRFRYFVISRGISPKNRRTVFLLTLIIDHLLRIDPADRSSPSRCLREGRWRLFRPFEGVHDIEYDRFRVPFQKQPQSLESVTTTNLRDRTEHGNGDALGLGMRDHILLYIKEEASEQKGNIGGGPAKSNCFGKNGKEWDS